MITAEVSPAGLEDLDFDPDERCEFYFNPQEESQCGAAAQWMVIHHCCGRQTFICGEHHLWAWCMMCRDCRTDLNASGCRWIKL